jgi:hypothetical protein
MVKANYLIKRQEDKENKKYITFAKIYNNIEKKIIKASERNLYYTYYQIPQILIGFPTYSIKDCYSYIDNKLKADGFKTDEYFNNIILISWFPTKSNKI